MITLENEQLKVTIALQGAEIKSVIDKASETEYMWQADPAYWGRTSPVLFPIVGRLTEDMYYVDGKSYQMTQHGFARDCAFTCTKQTAETACFVLKDSEATRTKYPFAFELMICYKLVGNHLDVIWQVTNNESLDLPFSIGAHPAFSLRLYDALEVEDYYFEFDKELHIESKMLNKNGQFSGEVKSFGTSDSLRINPDIFVNDALVLDAKKIKKIAIKNIRNARSVIMDLSSFTYKEEQPLLGLWSPYSDGGIAPFVCLEPWFGHADTASGPFELKNKPGIISLAKNEVFSTVYGLTFE